MISRRSFIARGGTLCAAGCAAAPDSRAASAADRQVSPGLPALQAPGADSVWVAWSVPAPSFVAVEVSESPDFSGGSRRFFPPCDACWSTERVAQVQLTGLVPSRRYWYRTLTAAITRYKNAWEYDLAPEQVSPVWSFVMPGASSRFAVISDTHGFPRAVRDVFAKVEELAPSLVVWNGDVVETLESEQDAVRCLLEPPQAKGFAARRPYVLLNGNHECRGAWSNNRARVFKPSGAGPFPWNTVLRVGEVALIGLDTSEPTSSKVWCGGARFQAFRDRQTAWLKAALARPDVASAPFIVPVYHVPIVPETETNCLASWGRLFTEAGVTAAIAGHTHTPTFHAPDATRPWAEIVGGGPIFGEFFGDRGHLTLPHMFPTVILCDVEKGRLVVTVYDLWRRKVFGEWSFAPRKKRSC